MAVSTRTLLNLMRDIARETGYASGRATSGTTTQLVDTSADSPFESDDDSELYKNAWLMIEGVSGVDAATVQTSSRARSTNVTTIVTAAAHGLATSDIVTISGLGGSGYNQANVTITVTNSTTFTYANTGTDESTTTDLGGAVSPKRPTGEIRRIRAYTPASQQIDLRNAYAVTLGTTHDYGVYLGVPPERFGSLKGLKEYINEVLRETYYRTLAPLSLAADADMEAAGTASWTATNATLAKATTKATGVRWGAQALQVTDSGSGNGYASQNFDVVPGQTYTVAVDAFGSTTSTGTQVTLNCYDVTSSANITNGSYTGTIDAGQQRTLAVTAAIPTGCKLMRVELKVVTLSGVGYFDNLSVRNAASEEMDLPSWIENPAWVEDVQFMIPGGEVTSYGFQQEEGRIGKPQYFKVLTDHTGITAYRIKFWPQARYDSHVFIQALRRYPALETLDGTTACNRDLVRARVLTRIYADQNNKEKALRWAQEADVLDRAYNALARPQQQLQSAAQAG